MSSSLALYSSPQDLSMVSTMNTKRSKWGNLNALKPQRSRWGAVEDKAYLPPPFVDLPAALTVGQIEQFMMEQRLEDLTQKIRRKELEIPDADVYQVPDEFEYDAQGNRVNTKDAKIRNQMTAEWRRLIDEFSDFLPNYVPPAEMRPSKLELRIKFPLDKYPDYNFIGVILGPRGTTHKHIETVSGCQISIRGQNTAKDSRRNNQSDVEARMPQHAYICGETEAQVAIAAKMITALLDPTSEQHSRVKDAGLMQLATIQGSMLEGALSEVKCPLCSCPGHLASECPDVLSQSILQNKIAKSIQCELCGDKGHITSDCKLAKEPGRMAELKAKREKDREVAEIEMESAAATLAANEEAAAAAASAQANAASEIVSAVMDGLPGVSIMLSRGMSLDQLVFFTQRWVDHYQKSENLTDLQEIRRRINEMLMQQAGQAVPRANSSTVSVNNSAANQSVNVRPQDRVVLGQGGSLRATYDNPAGSYQTAPPSRSNYSYGGGF